MSCEIKIQLFAARFSEGKTPPRITKQKTCWDGLSYFNNFLKGNILLLEIMLFYRKIRYEIQSVLEAEKGKVSLALFHKWVNSGTSTTA